MQILHIHDFMIILRQKKQEDHINFSNAKTAATIHKPESLPEI